MSDPFADPVLRAQTYATQRGLVFQHSLGYGKDGSVFATNVGTAVKVFGSFIPFRNELACYLRLQELEVTEVLGHNVPEFIDADEELLVLEMKIVQPPYILDFASSQLDIPPEFPDHVLAQWESDRLEEFGQNWPHVKLLIHLFAENFAIHLLDVHPRNITFPTEAPGGSPGL